VKSKSLFAVLMLGAVGLGLCSAGVTMLVQNRPEPSAVATPVPATQSWYLLMPQTYGDKCFDDLPYSKWMLMDSYATSAECHKAVNENVAYAYNQQFLNNYVRDLKKQGYPVTARALSQRMSEAFCLASDDLHLQTPPAPAPTPQPEAPAADPGYKSL
jgi:hypothetical protein